MTTKRIITALTAIAISGVLLAGCTTTASPTPSPSTTSASPTPTTGTPVPPPANEEEAITSAKDAITLLLETQSEINAAGGTDSARYEEIAVDKALQIYQADALRIAKGPLANEDGENVEGQATTEGAATFEPITAYGQEYNSTPNGLVIIPSCLDISNYRITTADGKPAYRPASDRNKVEYQVIYDTERQKWLVSNQIDMGETC